MKEFLDALVRAIEARIRIGIHYGVVTVKHTHEIDVKVSGSDTALTNVKYLDSFSPAVDDVVVLLTSKNDIIAIGVLHKP